MEKKRLICGCARVHDEDIKRAIASGASTFDEVAQITKAGTGCGNCRILIERMLREETK